jgi:hypothetical protein
MTYEEMMAYAVAALWTVLSEKDYSEDGYTWTTVEFDMDDGYGLAVSLTDGKIDDIQRFGMWEYPD